MAAPLTDYLLSKELTEDDGWDYCDGGDWSGPVEEIRAVHFHTAELSAEQQAFLLGLPKLEALAFCEDYEHSDASLARITELVEQKQITDVEIEEARHLVWLERFPQTKVLRLKAIYSLSAEQLAPVAKLEALERLDLSGKDVEVEHLKHLSGLRALRTLNLSGNDELTDLGALAELSELRELDLEGSGVADLTPLAGLTQLEVLNLTGCKVTSLAPLVGLSALRKLTLNGCPLASVDELKHLKQAPLKVLKLRGCPVGSMVAMWIGSWDLEEVDLFGTGVTGAQLVELGVEPKSTFPEDLELATERNAEGEWAYTEADEFEGDLSQVRAAALAHHWCDEPGVLTFLAFLPQLEALNLESVSDLPLSDFAAICRLSQLRELNLSGADFSKPDEDADDSLDNRMLLELIKGLPNLERLNLSGAECTPAGLVQLRKLSKLRELSLSSLPQAGQALEQLSELPLEALDLSQNALHESDPKLLGRLRLLKRLDVSNNLLKPPNLEALRSCEALEELNLQRTQLSDVGALEGFAALRTLNLSDNALTDGAGPVLGSLVGLTALNLENNSGVGDALIRALSGATQLERLELGGTAVTEAVVPQLIALGLKRLGLRGVWLEEESRQQLEAAGIEDLDLSALDDEDDSDRGTFAGLLVRPFAGRLAEPTRGVAWRVASNTYDPEFPLETLLGRLLADPRAGEVEALVLGAWESAYDTPPTAALELLIGAKDTLSSLRAIYLGDMDGEECEISWIHHADLSPLLAAYPQLEVLKVRGSEGLELPQPLALPKLRELTIECGGLPGEVLEAIASASLPELEHLELYLGVEDYGWDGSLDSLTPILSGKAFPKLRYLGIKDSESQDEIAQRVATAPVLGQLEVLDLSLGVLTDAGAQALLANEAALVRLRRLDLSHNFLSEAVAQKLEGLPIEVDVSERQDEDEEYRYVAVSE